MIPVDEFLARYTREYDFYDQVARLCARLCEARLEQSGIRSIVTHRAKRWDRVRDKLTFRNDTKHYSSVSDIYLDLVDLAGVRIALYFPGERAEVVSILNAILDVDLTRTFPVDPRINSTYHRRFSGYHATHVRARLRADSVAEQDKRYCGTLIEVQVASVLMHAWSEVEHDLIYKPTTGNLSSGEYALLDQVNGLTLAGEIALEQLQAEVKLRVSRDGSAFANHYELASFIYSYLKENAPATVSEINMGRADILFSFLRRTGLDNPAKLKVYLARVEPLGDSGVPPIAEQLIDFMVADDVTRLSSFEAAKHEGGRNPDDFSDYLPVESEIRVEFLRRWSGLSVVSRIVSGREGDSSLEAADIYQDLESIRDCGWISDKDLEGFEGIKGYYAETFDPDAATDRDRLDLFRAAGFLGELLERVRVHAPDNERARVDEILNWLLEPANVRRRTEVGRVEAR